jgi:predicted Zn-dependent peptidase
VKQEQVGNGSRFALRNGITVLISEQHAESSAVLVAYFRTQRLNQSEFTIARILQKALLTGDLQSAPFKNTKAIRAVGGKVTAEVGRDHTYFCTLAPSKSFNEVLAAQAEMLIHPSLTSESASRAAQIIEAENARQCEDPAAYAIGRMNDLAASSPGGNASGPGDDRTVVNQDRLTSFYKGHYRPENLVLSVAGDISTFDTLVQIERLYADFGSAGSGEENAEGTDKTVAPAGGKDAGGKDAGGKDAGGKEPARDSTRGGDQKAAEPPPQHAAVVESPSLRYMEGRGKTNQSIVTVGYRAAGLKSDDWPAIEILTGLLGQGRASALNLALFFNQGVVSRVVSEYSAGPDAGQVSIQLWLAPGSIDKAEAALFKEIDRIIKARPDSIEIARAKSTVETRFNEKVETLTGAALTMAEYGAAGESVPTPADLISRLESVTPEEVQYVAAKYLALSNASIHEYEPSSAPARSFDSASFARTVVSWAPGLAQSPGESPVARKPANSAQKENAKEKAARNQAEAEAQNIQPLPVKDFSTLNGPKVFVREDHHRPQVTIAILFQGGRLSETPANSGITDLMLRLLLYGTPRITREQAAMALDKAGADVSIVNSPDYFGFAMTCLSRNAGEALRLLRDLIEVSAFRDPDLERARQEQLSLVRAVSDSGRDRSDGLMLGAMFQDHPYGAGPHGSEAAIEKLKTDDLKDWYTKTIKSQFPLVVIVGDTDGSALVSEGIAGEFKRRDLADTLKARIPARPANVEKSEQSACPVTIQYLGFPGPKQDSKDLTAMDLIQAALNGPGGGLEEDLVYKQKAGWAMWLGYRAMATAGLVYAGVESSAGDQQRARAAIISKLQQIAANGLSAVELKSAQELAATSALEALGNPEQRALAYAQAMYSKREASYVDDLPDAFEKISAADVKRVAGAYLKPVGYSVGMLQGTPSPKQPAPAVQ